MSRLDEAVLAASEIPGWMSHGELVWLGEQAAERKVIVEVGSYRGRSTKVLAMMTDGVVYSVDNLRGEKDPPPAQGAQPSDGDNLDSQFRENLAQEIESGKVRIVRTPSPQAAKSFRRMADMCFIDGNHSYTAVCADIRAWRKRLKPDGLLCGHDRPHDTVQRALGEFLINGEGPDRIWYR